MKLKKMLSAILALTMILALSVPAFATENNDGTAPTEVEISGTVTPAEIKVTIPTAGDVIVNPYKMSVTPSGGSATTDQIISATQYIQNVGKAAVQVSASVTGTASSGVTFATTKHEGATKAVTTKSVFMYFEMMRTDDTSTEPTWGANYDAKSNNQILVGTKAVAKANMLTLAAGDGTAVNATKGCAAFHLVGDANATPATAWTADDTVTVNVAFTVLPTGAAVE